MKIFCTKAYIAKHLVNCKGGQAAVRALPTPPVAPVIVAPEPEVKIPEPIVEPPMPELPAEKILSPAMAESECRMVSADHDDDEDVCAEVELAAPTIENLTVRLFNGAEIRIFGTADDPLFIANDVAKVLEITNVCRTISNFESYEKTHIRIRYSASEHRVVNALTEAGLYALVIISKKPAAREFRKWLLTEVLPSIRKNGKYSLEEVETLKRDLEIARSQIAAPQKTEAVVHHYDINDYVNNPCVYIIHLIDTDYKFGVSGEIDVRTDAHMVDFKKEGCAPKCIKVWKCETMQIMKDVEMKIKRLAKQQGILCTKYGKKKEIFSTPNIDYIISRIDKYVDDMTSAPMAVMKIRKIEAKKSLVDSHRALVDSHRSLADSNCALAAETRTLADSQRLLIDSQKTLIDSVNEGKRLDLELARLRA